MGENPFESLCHHPSSVEDETEFFMRELRSLEFRAYAALLSAFRAGGELDEEKRGVLGLIREKLNISELRHKCEVRRVATNPRLATIANKIHGCNTNQEWIDEGFCESPYISGMSRFPPAKISDRLLSSIDKTEKKKEKKRKFSTAHDFGRAIKTERAVDPSAPIPNGWGSDIDDEKVNFEKIIKAESSSSSSCESESSVDISYTSLKKKGRIRLQKRSMLNKLKKIKHEHEEKMGLSVVPSSPPPPQHQQQPSPDVVDATSPVKREAVQPSRRGRGAKRKILCPTTGKIKLAPVPRKQIRLDEQTGETIVESKRGGLTRGRGSRGGMRRGGLANGRGKLRLGMKSGQGRVLKIKTPKTKKEQLQQQQQQQQAPQQSKRKQLDEIRQELKSDESDREKDTEKSEPLKRSSSTESVNRDTSSDSESEARGKHSDSTRPPLGEQFRASPKQVPVSVSSESEAELRMKEVVEPRRESSPAVHSGMNFPDKSKTPPKPPPRSPLPAPVFSTSLDSVNKKRANKILNNFPPISSEGMSSSASGVPTASSLAARRPPVFSSTPPSVAKPTGIMPQRKAQPHILVNSKAQRNIANAAITCSSSSSITGTLNSGNSVPIVSSSVIQPQQQNVVSTNPQVPKVGGFGPSFPVVSSLGMGTPSFGSMKTSQGANIILLQKAPGGGLSPATATVVGSSASIMSSTVSGSPVITSGTGVGGMPINPAGMQQLPQKNSPRAVILRRANLPRQGNVMILDMQKNQVVSANQVPNFLQTARILNTPELALMANIQNQGNAVRKIVTSAGQVVSSGIAATSVASVTVSTSGGLSVATSSSNAVNHGIPLRFPINSSQLQQLQQQQQSAQLKAKRVGRVFSPRDLKTVIRVSAVPVQTASVLPVTTTPSITPAEEPKVPPKEQSDTLLASASSQQAAEEQEAILQETVYEEVVSSDRSESTNIPESCNEQVVPLESSNNSDQLLPIEDRTVEISSSECNNQFIPEENGDDDDNNAQEEIIMESVIEDFIVNTGHISSSAAASGLTEDIFQTALKSSGLDFSGNDDDFAVNDDGTCTNVAHYPVQQEIAVSTAPSGFPYRIPEVQINEEVVTTQH